MASITEPVDFGSLVTEIREKSVKGAKNCTFSLNLLDDTIGDRVVQFDAKEYSVCCFGRLASSEIVIKSNVCSRHHAIVYFSDGTPVIRDLDSRTGTLLNGNAIQPMKEYPLSDGDIIAVVNQRYVFHYIKKKIVQAPAEPLIKDKKYELNGKACPYCNRFIPELTEQLRITSEKLASLTTKIDSMNIHARKVMSEFVDIIDETNELKIKAKEISQCVSTIEINHVSMHENFLAQTNTAYTLLKEKAQTEVNLDELARVDIKDEIKKESKM